MFGRILVGTDGSDTAKVAVQNAADLAAQVGAKLDIVSAYEPVSPTRLKQEQIDAPKDVQWAISPKEDVDAILEEATGSVGDKVEVETYAREGDAADAILDVAEEQKVDLIVVGNKGMSGARRFLLGSVPNKISHHAPCAVMIVRTT